MNIVVGLDSSSQAEQILNRLAEQIWPVGAVFWLVTAIEPSYSWDSNQQYMSQARTILEERAERLRDHLKTHSVIGNLVEGPAGSALLSKAKELSANLIIIGSHGDTGVRRRQLGSVAAAVVNKAPCTVEVIKLTRTALAS
jgi:nucleotide-binding universal stress UspA family protein